MKLYNKLACTCCIYTYYSHGYDITNQLPIVLSCIICMLECWFINVLFMLCLFNNPATLYWYCDCAYIQYVYIIIYLSPWEGGGGGHSANIWEGCVTANLEPSLSS